MDDLRKLIERWRERAEWVYGGTRYGRGQRAPELRCADELERELEGRELLTDADRAVLDAAERWVVAPESGKYVAYRRLVEAVVARRAAMSHTAATPDTGADMGHDPCIRASDLEALANHFYAMNECEIAQGIMDVAFSARGRK